MRSVTPILGLCAIAVMAGCNMVSYTRVDAPQMFAALDTQANGYSGTFADAAQFQILETRANDALLCRKVRIQDQGNDATREYCKIKGGEWR